MSHRRNPVRAERQAPRERAARMPQSARHDAPGSGPIRLVVADHHAIDRAGLVGLLEKEGSFAVVAEAATVAETIERCEMLEPDVLVLALNLPAQNRGDALATIRARLSGLRILALSERGADNCLVLNPPSRKWLSGIPLGTCPVGIDCLQLAAHQGAMATLRRSADPQDLFGAIRAVAQGRSSYDPTTAAGMLAESGRAPRGAGRRLFSERESQVAALISEGRSNKEIASFLRIRESTVKKHVTHVLEKLGLEDRLQAGLYLARNPLLLES